MAERVPAGGADAGRETRPDRDGPPLAPDPLVAERNWRLEREAHVIHLALARAARDPDLSELFLRIAAAEARHAERWHAELIRLGRAPEPFVPSRPARLAGFLLRRFGLRAALPFVEVMERRELARYRALGGVAEPLAAEERGHAALVARARRSLRATGEWAVAAGRSGTLRAAVFGANDGLVSNLALVVGVAAAGVGSRIVILAGVAGLLAGAFSMGAGEYVSMRVQRELLEHLLAVEAAEVALFPEEGRRRIAGVYARRGLPPEEAEQIAARVMERPEAALEVRARELVGVAPDELGSPLGAGVASFLTFSMGAVVPVVPFLVASRGVALVAALASSGLALFLAGSALAFLTGQRVLVRGVRMLLIGEAASACTYAIGRLLGVTALG